MLGSGLDCRCGSWATGPARIGTTVDICQAGREGCHDCVWISLNAGPTEFGAPFNLTAPIGLPLLAQLGFDFPSGNDVCFSVPIPHDANLVGLTLYFSVLTHDYPLVSLDQFGFCGPLSVTIER